jgi:UDP-N-acetylmuramoylalanine--D-glutamate ligase
LKYLILGYGVTGKSVENYFNKIGANYVIHDDDENELKKVENSKIFNKKYLNSIDEVIISPGLRPDHHLVQQFLDIKVPIKTDIDIFAMNYTGKVIGVTGTNGKTTFVSELVKFLNINGISSFPAGNIGVSPLEILENKYDYLVLELSSYQLHYTNILNLDLAVILNIFPDHIDWHQNIEDYANSKVKILSFLNNKKMDRKIIGSNYGIIEQNLSDDANLNNHNLKIHKELLSALSETVKKIGGRVLYESFIDYIKYNEMHYEHRMEQFLRVRGKNLTFINDSKATNYHAVSEGTKLFSACDEEGILILHGITKETVQNKLNIDPTFKHIVIPKDMNVNLGSHNADIIYIDDIYQLKKLLPSMISSNQIILFSCGGSSFNDFENYKIRGDYFKNLILSMGLPND